LVHCYGGRPGNFGHHTAAGICPAGLGYSSDSECESVRRASSIWQRRSGKPSLAKAKNSFSYFLSDSFSFHSNNL
uniref:Uncharacterized protein n=1 Tax=Gongylonema pulchrum TaxID=637853 RepID=A0A183DHF5_9BILA